MNARGRSQRSDSPAEMPGAAEPATALTEAAGAIEPAEPAGDGGSTGDGGSAGAGPEAASGIASGHDATGIPVHRGWAPTGAHHRWMEPFVMVLLAGGSAHGYAIVGELAALGITNGTVDVGQVYRTLRDLEKAGQVRSAWSTAGSGPARRDYELTAAGYRALDEWAAVTKERARLIGEFDARYLESISSRRGP